MITSMQIQFKAITSVMSNEPLKMSWSHVCTFLVSCMTVRVSVLLILSKVTK